MQQLPTIETTRLVLRQLKEDDAQDVFDYFSKDEVTLYYDLETFTEVEQAANLIELWNDRIREGKGIRWAIILKEEINKVVGTCGYHNMSEEHNRAEIGYELHPMYWGKGLATEAVKAIAKYGKTKLKLHRIEAFINPAHRASERVLNKVGMETEGILRDYFFEKGRFVDAQILSIIFKEK